MCASYCADMSSHINFNTGNTSFGAVSSPSFLEKVVPAAFAVTDALTTLLSFAGDAKEFNTNTAIRFVHDFEFQHESEALVIDCFVNKRAAERFRKFTEYSDGWDGKGSRGLSLVSLKSLTKFISKYRLNRDDVGIFMSSQGNLILNWPVNNDGLAEVEFHGDKLEFYFEANDHGEVLSLSDDCEKIDSLMRDAT